VCLHENFVPSTICINVFMVSALDVVMDVITKDSVKMIILENIVAVEDVFAVRDKCVDAFSPRATFSTR